MLVPLWRLSSTNCWPAPEEKIWPFHGTEVHILVGENGLGNNSYLADSITWSVRSTPSCDPYSNNNVTLKLGLCSLQIDEKDTETKQWRSYSTKGWNANAARLGTTIQ